MVKKILAVITAVLMLAACTTTTTGGDRTISEQAIAERMEAVGSFFPKYCGSEGVSLRAFIRVFATAFKRYVIQDPRPLWDACAGYNSARAEAIKQIEAERMVLESGLLDQQTGAGND